MPLRKQDSSVFDNFELRLNDRSKKFLRETSKWAFILAIIGFVMIGLMLFFAIFSLFVFSQINSGNGNVLFGNIPPYTISIIYFVLAVILFFPVLYLYKFSRKMKVALAEKNTGDLTMAFSKLKSYFKFLGIATLIIIALYIIALLFAIIAGASTRF